MTNTSTARRATARALRPVPSRAGVIAAITRRVAKECAERRYVPDILVAWDAILEADLIGGDMFADAWEEMNAAQVRLMVFAASRAIDEVHKLAPSFQTPIIVRKIIAEACWPYRPHGIPFTVSEVALLVSLTYEMRSLTLDIASDAWSEGYEQAEADRIADDETD